MIRRDAVAAGMLDTRVGTTRGGVLPATGCHVDDTGADAEGVACPSPPSAVVAGAPACPCTGAGTGGAGGKGGAVDAPSEVEWGDVEWGDVWEPDGGGGPGAPGAMGGGGGSPPRCRRSCDRCTSRTAITMTAATRTKMKSPWKPCRLANGARRWTVDIRSGTEPAPYRAAARPSVQQVTGRRGSEARSTPPRRIPPTAPRRAGNPRVSRAIPVPTQSTLSSAPEGVLRTALVV